MSNQHIGSDFDDFLQEEGIREEVTAAAIKRVIAWPWRSKLLHESYQIILNTLGPG